MFGMLWIDVYNSVFQFPPISSNFAQPLKRSETTFHRVVEGFFKINVIFKQKALHKQTSLEPTDDRIITFK
jgi:hypothetical protein